MRNQSSPDVPTLLLSKYSMSSALPVMCSVSSPPEAPMVIGCAWAMESFGSASITMPRFEMPKSTGFTSTRNGTFRPAGQGVCDGKRSTF